MLKNLPAHTGDVSLQVQSLVWEDPLEHGMAPPVSLPGEAHGQRSLAGYSPWGLRESDKTETI